jgi:hypothetical protein
MAAPFARPALAWWSRAPEAVADLLHDQVRIGPAVGVAHAPQLPSLLGDRDRPLGHVGAAPHGMFLGIDAEQPWCRVEADRFQVPQEGGRLRRPSSAANTG